MKIADNIHYVGVNDRRLDLFEGQFIVPNGMAYNSYVITDEKVAVLDSVDASFKEEWLDHIRQVLGDRTPDYLVVLHMEPDHSANIAAFADAYPDAVLVASDKAFAMMNKYFGTDYALRRLVVKEGDTLSLGAHTLQFFTAPMVHWPEVLLAYEQQEKVLFSADA
ncbi:MAG: MBL fold metallo-hydrolase, partial [Clostridia bacterium]|nr:MBL fold metallo-hydrolase [Clostridia bacterium]